MANRLNASELMVVAGNLFDAAFAINEFANIPNPSYAVYQECLPSTLADILDAASAILFDVGILESAQSESSPGEFFYDPPPASPKEATEMLDQFVSKAKTYIDECAKTGNGDFTALAVRTQTFACLLKQLPTVEP